MRLPNRLGLRQQGSLAGFPEALSARWNGMQCHGLDGG